MSDDGGGDADEPVRADGAGDGLVEVGPAEGFEDGDHRLVQIGRAEVGVIRSDGDFYAFRNQCPHDGGPVCTGNVHRKLVADFRGPGQRVGKDYAEEKVLSCPWHGWSFDLETGRHVGDRSIVLPSYDVVVEDGVVYVDSGR